MDVCKCIVFLRHGVTLNSDRVASPSQSWWKRMRGEWALTTFRMSFLEIEVKNGTNRTVTCMVFKSTDNDRRHLALSHDEIRGPCNVTFRKQQQHLVSVSL
ncbi:hypothetical protein TNCV_3961511 [Trichonephila clavipes]|nr:hypothetical protein TNCV_3961511 [Trichonephila clavipes]